MPSRRNPPAALSALTSAGVESVETSFAEVVGLIEQARQRAYQAVNTELVGLYWEIGRYISAKLEAAVWGGQHLPLGMLDHSTRNAHETNATQAWIYNSPYSAC